MDIKIAVVGLGYVGLPLAVEFAKKYKVIGFDISENRINELKKGKDRTNEINPSELKNENILFTENAKYLKECNFIIVTVPTPITSDKLPDLNPLLKASAIIGENLSIGTTIVYESTVYPGVTEEECVPVLLESSSLIYGKDFFVGYSPERINPGDKKNKISNIVKVVSGQNNETLEKIATLYGSIITAGVYKATSIKVAEAAKVIENTQRDLNISLMNELATIFDILDIDTNDVIEAASTKWNFLKFKPGLVGGHCIAVDPYYLTYKAEKAGYIPQVILAGRRVNDNVSKLISTSIVKKMIEEDMKIKESVITVLGLTFKENVSDIRNTKVIDLIKELKEYGFRVNVADPHANIEEVKREFNIDLQNVNDIKDSNCVILAVSHQEFIDEGWKLVESLLQVDKGIVYDIKGSLNREDKPEKVILCRL
ncbi:nucleotide sugar dehydrogenase [Planococcus halotolerans]|uniref:Nucleotide sugar dehydrogenase n=1 Tax=Planococcus halotolerans TaxID=2233542 RepID=A0A365L5L9_9BACL|nr:nucleotide sugar dehydrogenase [Planococcus halotolerans]RAZ80712.1 nucleotide sugar dehydrogenase [Planococcus halotolerans]